MGRCIFLLNSGSGGNQRGLDAAGVCAAVEKAFGDVGHDTSSVVVQPGAIRGAVARALATAPDMVIAGGGDGTVAAVAELLGGTGLAMGILPLGTFNLAARDMGVPLEVDAAARFLAAAEPMEVDVLDVSGHACLCTTIIGFYPKFAGMLDRREYRGQWWRKAWKVLGGLWPAFSQARPLWLRWQSEDHHGVARTKWSAFVPGRYKTTTGVIPERCDFTSGRFTAYIGSHVTAASALRGLLDHALGRHEDDPGLEVFQAAELTLQGVGRRSCRVMIDGEILRLKFPIHLRILPRHLKVLGTPEH